VWLAAAIVLLAALADAPSGAAALLAEADRHFSRRGQDARGARCHPEPIDAALDSYRAALASDPALVPARVGILRSLFFRAGYCGEGGEAQKRRFEQAKRLAEDSEKWIEGHVGAKLRRGRVEPFRPVPGAAALFFWCGVSWGQWSLDHKLAAAWQGAARRVRDLGELALALDPEYEQGSPHLLLGRLHTESPKIPLVTGFVSRRQGFEHLRRAHAIAPANSVARFFLADAMLRHEPSSRTQALRLLRECAAADPRPDYLVEDRHYAEKARERLRALGEAP